MGLIDSVGTSYSFDAVRNPALLPQRKEKTSYGFFAIYRPFFDTGVDIQFANDAVTNEMMSIENKSSISGSFFAAFCKNYGKSAWSIALASGGGAQFTHAKNQESSSYFHPTLFNVSTGKNSERTDLNPSLLISYGMKLTRSSSIGFQLTTLFTVSRETKEEYLLSTLPGSSFSKTEEGSNRLAFMGTAGYFLKLGKADLGFMIRTGKVSGGYSTIKYSYFSSGIGNPPAQGDGETRYQWVYDLGPGFAFGVLAHATSYLNFAFETEFYLPVGYNQEALSFNESIGYHFSNNYHIYNSAAGTVKVGFELIMSRFSTLTFGGGIGYSHTKKTGNKNVPITQKSLTVSYYITGGFDYQFSTYSTFFIGVQYSIVTMNTDVTLTGFYLDLETSINYIDSFIGVSYGF